jgi:3-hydroxyisobutyrate dehydrogenase-like beta-hydroxyacid dehydrogenase
MRSRIGDRHRENEIVERVAIIGLGAMGRGIAGNLLAKGRPVTVYNRTAGRAEGLTGDLRVASSPADAAKGASFVISMVADDVAVEGVIEGKDGILAGMDADAIHISMSTIGVAAAKDFAARHAAAKRHFVSAPVFGRPPVAAEGKLRLAVAGPAALLERCKPLFEQIGQAVFTMGEKAELANVVKLAGNVAIASMAETLAETFALVSKSGIETAKFMELITTVFSSPMYTNYAAIMQQEKFDTNGFKLKLAYKDLGLAQAAASAAQVPMPLLAAVQGQLLAGVARGMGDQDLTAVSRVVKANAGL